MWDDYIDVNSLDLEDLKALKNDLLDLLAEINERINEEEEYDEDRTKKRIPSGLEV